MGVATDIVGSTIGQRTVGLRMAETQREQRFARHADGRVWDANNVTPAVKDGPWTCATQGCPLRYDRVTGMHRRSRRGNEHTVNGSFRAAAGDVHDLSLTHHVVPLSMHTTRVDDGSRRHISRVTGLQGPQPQPRETTVGGGGVARTEYEYGPDMHGLRALVLTAREYEADPAAFRERRFKVPGGITYFWPDLWTGADRSAYQRTQRNMHDQFALDGSAYFVEGFARDTFLITPDSYGREWIKLKLNTDFREGRGEIQLHLPNTADNRAHLQHIQWKTPLAVWSHRILKVGDFVLLTAPDWTHVLADDSPGMISPPRSTEPPHVMPPSPPQTEGG